MSKNAEKTPRKREEFAMKAPRKYCLFVDIILYKKEKVYSLSIFYLSTYYKKDMMLSRGFLDVFLADSRRFLGVF